jgi:TatA/E family protein of Tat protein translocase
MLSGLENPVHLLILLLIVLFVFGAKRLTEMGKSLGSVIGLGWPPASRRQRLSCRRPIARALCP